MERYRGPEQPHSIAPRQCAVCPVQASTERTERDMQNESAPGARGPVFCGVDTHADSHWLCVLDWRGRKVLSRQFPADAAGYEALAGAIAAAGEPACVAMEGTSSYGAGLTRHLASLGMPVREALSPARTQRRRPGQGKCDEADAERAARAAISGSRLGTVSANLKLTTFANASRRMR
ncbi:IS110 family transposase [Collinsella aerofaciens]